MLPSLAACEDPLTLLPLASLAAESAQKAVPFHAWLAGGPYKYLTSEGAFACQVNQGELVPAEWPGLSLLPCMDCCLTKRLRPHKSSPAWHELGMH